jgi:NAD(P)-dependent dehydrogenase (short-subunit alcohol dehydrogenase family)
VRTPEHRDPQVVLITGASSGIGEATALLAAERGDHLVLLARGVTALSRVAVACKDAGASSVTTLSADVGDDEAVAAAVESVLAEHGRLDVVVSSAGVVAYGRLEEVPAEVFDRVLQTNLHGMVNLARHVVPVLRDQGRGSLVLVGSVIGHIAVPEMSSYVLSKWGIRALARQLRLENRDLSDVRIGYVAPGGVDTPIYLQAATYAGVAGRPPMPVASPEKVARRVLGVADGSAPDGQVNISNHLIRLGFTALPAVYDALVAPLFKLAAQDQTTQVPPTTGNVLEPREDRNALRGDQGNALVGVVRNVGALWIRRPVVK